MYICTYAYTTSEWFSIVYMYTYVHRADHLTTRQPMQDFVPGKKLIVHLSAVIDQL